MSKLVSVALSIFIFSRILMPTSVFAANAGITPDSFWYRFELFFERVSVSFIFNNDRKAKKELDYAEERLAEAEVMAKKKKTNETERALSEYSKRIESAKENKESIVEDAIANHVEVLERVLEQVPEAGKSGVERAIESSYKVIDQSESQKSTQLDKKPVRIDESDLENIEKNAMEQGTETDEESMEPQAIERTLLPPPELTPPTTRPVQEVCTEDRWNCSEWSECSQAGKQARDCNLVDDCTFVFTKKPITSQLCIPFQSPEPKAANNPIPANMGIDVPTNTNLSWKIDKNVTLQYLYFGTDSPPAIKEKLNKEITYTPGNLSKGTTYYWRISTWMDDEIAVGPIWSFTTEKTVVSPPQSVTVMPTPPLPPPSCSEDIWECTDWGTCDEFSQQGRSCHKAFDCPGVETTSPNYWQKCEQPAPACTEDVWQCNNWQSCSVDGSQERNCSKTFDCPNVESQIPPSTQSCTSPWKQQLDNLSIPGYAKTTDGLGNLILTSGKYKVILPDENAEDYGKFRLNELMVCSQFIENIIGSGLNIGTNIVDITVIDESSDISYCCGNAPDYEITNKTSRANFNSLAFSSNAYWKNSSINYNSCPGGHEEVHRYVKPAPFPSWANEGLATFIEQKARDLPGVIASRSLHSCDAETFSASGFTGGLVNEPYRDVTILPAKQPIIYFYYTGACFWDNLEKNYGANAIKQVIGNLFSGTFNLHTEFIQKAVIPVTGESIWGFLNKIGLES